MYKKNKVALLKRRNKRQQRVEQRKLSRRLLSGEISLAQAERLAGQGLRGVLKTADYLSKKEGVSINPTLAEAIVKAVTPAFTSFTLSRTNTKSSPSQSSTTQRRSTISTHAKPARATAKSASSEAETSAKPARATAKSASSEAETSAKPARATAKPASKTEGTQKKVSPAPKLKSDTAKPRARTKDKTAEN